MWRWLRNQWRELRRPVLAADASAAAATRARLERAQADARALTDQVAELEAAIGIARCQSDAAIEQEAALREPLSALRLEIAELSRGRSHAQGFGALYQQQRELVENDTASLLFKFEQRVAELRALSAQHQDTLDAARETAATALASLRRAQELFETQSRRYRELQQALTPEQPAEGEPAADPLDAFMRSKARER